MPEHSHEQEEVFEEFFFDFDSADLKRFLQKLPRLIPSGFGAPQVEEVLQNAKNITPRLKLILDFPIEFEKASTKLVVVLYSEEPQLQTLYLYALPSLIASVEDELSRFVEESPED